jgi:hypothetical protein
MLWDGVFHANDLLVTTTLPMHCGFRKPVELWQEGR